MRIRHNQNENAMRHPDLKALRASDGRLDWINVGGEERFLSLFFGGILGYAGSRRRGSLGSVMLVAGGVLAFRGITGFSMINAWTGRNTSQRARALRPLDLQTTFTVDLPREDVAAFWRQIDNLPRFMRHLEEVREIGEGRAHWVASLPGGLGTVAWDADVRHDDTRMSWRSVPGSPIENTGEVVFRDAPGGRGTEVRARISYRPPAGRVGRATSILLTPVFNQMVKEDIRRFKNVIEAGEIPTARMSTEERDRPGTRRKEAVGNR
jgi:uncharacterized membrane protein